MRDIEVMILALRPAEGAQSLNECGVGAIGVKALGDSFLNSL
jgi:tRNA(Arg) A34 adenosine deaminase TadA